MTHVFLALGTIGSLCFVFSGLPQAHRSFKEGHSRGVTYGTVLLWFTGESTMLAYTLYFYPTDYILLANYVMSLLWVGIILRYRFWERSDA